MKTGVCNLPLHHGKIPPWLFQRMALLSRQIILFIIEEVGLEEVLRKLADPHWFQAFGCVLGFDWHSSGLTTTVCGALKEGMKGLEKEIGLFVAGGKGKRSLDTPKEIKGWAERLSLEDRDLIYASKMAAKVDSAGLQDGYSLYHHCFVFTQKGDWVVIQQGMNIETRYARRYHWISFDLQDFVCEPHLAICCDRKESALNMVASESEEAREITTLLSQERPFSLVSQLKRLKELNLPPEHHVPLQHFHTQRLEKILLKSYELKPPRFESLLGIEGLGPKTILALALIAELVYGISPSFRDPVRFSFAHGGKDGHPYPLNKKTYDKSIEILEKAISKARIGNKERLEAIQRLRSFYYF